MQKMGWKLGFLAILAGLYPVLEQFACQRIYAFFEAGAVPRGSDAIVVLGGGGGDRIRRGLQLLEQGYAPRILFLGTAPEMQFAFRLAKDHRDWASGRICFGDRAVRNTSDSIRHLLEWTSRRGVRECLVISNANHLGRVSAQLAHFQDKRLKTHLVSTGTPPSMDVARNRWSVLHEASAYVLVRLGKILRPQQDLGLPPSAFLL